MAIGAAAQSEESWEGLPSSAENGVHRGQKST